LGFFALENFQRIAPDVTEFDGAGQWAVCSLGELYILRSIIDARLMKFWVSWLREGLIDPSPGHHITA